MKLTEKEFDTIIEALEQLPNKSQDGKFFAKLLGAMLVRDDEQGRQRMEEEMAIADLKMEAERRTEKKRCGIIAGKLYMMKEQIVEERS